MGSGLSGLDVGTVVGRGAVGAGVGGGVDAGGDDSRGGDVGGRAVTELTMPGHWKATGRGGLCGR